MTTPLKTGALIALAAGSLFAAACNKKDEPKAAAGGEKTETVKCLGINECKGHGSCKTANNACAGQNGCKGQGWVSKKTAEECTKAGGKVEK